ncbi:MAG: Autotransporter-associated beta strand repeat-containing protein, partial [Verrucomicrobiaceae bacterium]|nr:Autotransporter-associated beta strand repeat-containing protein [Verrucomicrobiaceae bacterium]
MAYGGPGLLDSTNGSTIKSPIVGSRLEFYRNSGLMHSVPIFMDGATAAANGGTNYIELNSDTIPGVSTYLTGTITVSGAAKNNMFNIEGGGGGIQSSQGNQVVDPTSKMIINGAIVNINATTPGGISKIGSRELRLTADNTYTGETIVTRSVGLGAPARSDTVTVNGVDYTNKGLAESWGEFGMTLNGAAGAISGTSNVILERSGMLTLDNSTRLDASSNVTTVNNNNRINDNASIKMNTGWLRIVGSESTDNSEALATGAGKVLTSNSGINMIDLWPSMGTGTNMTLTIGQIDRKAGSVLRFRDLDSNSNFDSKATVTAGVDSVRVKLNNIGTLQQSGADTSVTSRKIVLGLLGGSAPHTEFADTRINGSDFYSQERNRQNATGSFFMTYDTNTGYLRPLDDSEWATPTNGQLTSTGIVGGQTVVNTVAGQNVNLTDFNYYGRESVSINSLHIGPVADSNGSGVGASDPDAVSVVNDGTRLTSYVSNWQPTLYMDDKAVLTVASGMVSSAAFGVGNNNASTFIRGGTVNFGAAEGIINNQNYWLSLVSGVYSSNNFELQTTIAGSGGLTKVGGAAVVLDGVNTYTGVTTVDEGVLFARNGRNALGANGLGNGILIQGTGDFRMTNGIQLGAVGAPKNLTIGLGVADGQQALRSENGNNILYGNIMYDNVDSNGHAQPGARTRVSANTNQSLVIYGNIYGGDTAVTEDTYYTDARLLTINPGTAGGVGGFVTIHGNIGDHGDSSGNAIAVTSPVSSQPGLAGVRTNENQVFRLQISGSDDGNVVLDGHYNAAGRLALDRGILLLSYDPAVDAGFWSAAALAALTQPVTIGTGVNAFTTNISTSNAIAANGNTSMQGFLLGGNLGDAGGSTTSAIFLTRPNQNFNLGEWRVTSSSTGNSYIGGLNDSGTVTFGNTTATGQLSMDKTAVRFYQAAGGTSVLNYRLNGGNFVKIGRGTSIVRNSSLVYNSDTQTVEVGGGTLVLDNNGAFNSTIVTAPTLTTTTPVNLVGNQQFVGSGGALVVQGVTDSWLGLVNSLATSGNITVGLASDSGADGRVVNFKAGLTQVTAEARGGKNLTLTLGNNRSQTNPTLVRSVGATAAFAAYNSASAGSYTQTATTAASSTSAQTFTLGNTAVDGTVTVTDGTFTWSQASGTTNPWTVTYTASTNVVSVTYNPSVPSRTLTFTYQGLGNSRINWLINAQTTAALNNAIVPWAVFGPTPGLATDFAMIDALDASRVKAFTRSPDEYKN